MERADRFVIIMAGGKGERFWPVSREKTPKQLITLHGKKSFLQQAIDRVRSVVPMRNIFVITNSVQAAQVRKQAPKLPKENVIAEPVGRDTCAAVALGAAAAGARSANAVMAVLPADHVIPDERKFQQTLSDAFEMAASDRVIVTIGIKPTEPATGYGYIHVGAKINAPFKTPFNKVTRFVEKPPYDKAVKYLKSGEYRWNAGMFIWSVATLMEGFNKHRPEMAKAASSWMKKSGAGLNRALAKDYPKITKISIDFALLEHAKNVVVAAGDFAWDDLGAWPALARHLPADQSGNCAVGRLLSVDSSNNVVFDARKKNRTPIALVGIENCVVVQTDDVTLVAKKNDSQKLKELVKRLGESRDLKKLV